MQVRLFDPTGGEEKRWERCVVLIFPQQPHKLDRLGKSHREYISGQLKGYLHAHTELPDEVLSFESSDLQAAAYLPPLEHTQDHSEQGAFVLRCSVSNKKPSLPVRVCVFPSRVCARAVHGPAHRETQP